MGNITWHRDREADEWVGEVDGKAIATAHTTSTKAGYWGHYSGQVHGERLRTADLREFKLRAEGEHEDWVLRQANKDAHVAHLDLALKGLGDLNQAMNAAREAVLQLTGFTAAALSKGYYAPAGEAAKQQLAELNEAIENVKTAQAAVAEGIGQL